ncbi:MAG: hypothetical protein J5911_03040 [Clostridia bacterium]|nr:hypothetical protein [Clostridia bacterium]
MTKKHFLPKIKLLLVILSVLCAFCTCAFFVACNETQSTNDSNTKTYTYSETDTDIISNANFVYGTYDKSESDFPVSSPKGWTSSADNSATSSLVSSGVISVADSAFDNVFESLYKDNDFKNIYKHAYKADLDDKTDAEIKTFIKDKFANPGKHSEDADSFVYMMNNFSATYKKGTAQRIRSSSTVAMKKGTTYEVSVWVKTNILNGNGANIRLLNTLKGDYQSEIHIDNIIAEDWTKYTIYIVADDNYDCSFTLTLGLGYGMGKSDNYAKAVEGTVFFDDITVVEAPETIPEIPEDRTVTLDYGSSETVSLDGNNTVFKYDMSLAIPEDYFHTVNFDETTIALNEEIKTVDIKNDGNYFSITTPDEDDYEKYMLVTFKISNDLDPRGSTDITVNLIDKFGGADPETRKAVATFSDTTDGEFVDAVILVKNNFKDQTREFYLQIVIGPTDAASVLYNSDLATGSVTIKEVKFAEGYISRTEDETYKYYSLLSADADATVALYAGYNADFEQKNDTTSYPLTPAKSNVGKITSDPTAVDGYFGIVSDHVYIKGEGTDAELSNEVNTRTKFNTAKGYAGLINTKYLDNYKSKDSGLASALNGLYTESNDIQPIVIFNSKPDNYGFIGESKSLSSNEYAKVTVKLSVRGGAIAYVYLVDTSKSEKEILSFTDFTVNTDEGIKNAALNGTTITNKQFALEITATTPVGTDNWVEVSFYLATGADAKSFRVEVWNGGRTGEDKSAGYVFINSIETTLSSAFAEPTSWAQAFSSSSKENPLYNAMLGGFEFDEIIAYKRELTDTEKQFNKEYPDQIVSYDANYVWAKTSNMIYGIFNTINPTESNPYDNIEEEEKTGCAANTDPSTFWLSFSSFVLAAVLILAIITLFVKRYTERRKANRSDIKTQYKVKSRSETHKAIKKIKEQQAEKLAEDADEPEDEESNAEVPAGQEEPATEDQATEDAENETEQTGDETEQSGYVYGEVQDFGDMTLDVPESETPAEKPEEDKKDE